MGRKIFSNLSLSNKFVFILMSFLLIFTLTLINNYYFYSHVERTSSRQAIQLEKLLLHFIEKNIDSDKIKLQDELLSMIKEWKNYAYYNNGLMVIDFNNKEHVLKEFKKWDLTAYTDILINLNGLYNKNENGFILNSTIDPMQVLFSVWKSMTFSAYDIYKDITKIKISVTDGQIIFIEDAKNSYYDGIITINGDKFKDIEGAKNITIMDQKTLSKKIIYIPAYNELKVKAGIFIKKGDQLAQGTLHTAINNFKEIYWFRSRPFIGFAVFSFVLLFLFRKRTELLEKHHLEEIDKQNQSHSEEIEKLNKDAEATLVKQNRLDEERQAICNQFKNHSDFVKFAFLDTSIDELLEKNNRVLGTMFRLIAEKMRLFRSLCQ